MNDRDFRKRTMPQPLQQIGPSPVMKRYPLSVLAIMGTGFWSFVAAAAEATEPWDASAYWTLAYPLSLMAAVVVSFGMERRAWMVGLVLTMSQLPVMLVLGLAGSMTAFGLVFLITLAAPAMVVSALSGWLARSWCS